MKTVAGVFELQAACESALPFALFLPPETILLGGMSMFLLSLSHLFLLCWEEVFFVTRPRVTTYQAQQFFTKEVVRGAKKVSSLCCFKALVVIFVLLEIL